MGFLVGDYRDAVKKQEAWAEKLKVDIEFKSPSGIEFVLMPAGTFTMGGETRWDKSKPIHQVTITKPFYMGKYQVTQAQWKMFMEKNRSNFKGDNRPVEKVTWHDCQEFIEKLNDEEEVKKYRLPTEAEWEYACRAGTNASYCFGENDDGQLNQYAWYRNNSEDETHPVGQKEPNAWGLYDMHGNVGEWCHDRYGKYPKEAVTDPQGPPSSLFKSLFGIQVMRGGGAYFRARSCTAAIRNYYHHDSRFHLVGFRLARSL